jgi:hypothetical protein
VVTVDILDVFEGGRTLARAGKIALARGVALNGGVDRED